MTTCGNCKERNQTVDHVRACYSGRTIQSAVKAPTEAVTVTTLAQSPEEGIFSGCDDYGNVSLFKVVQSPNSGHWYAKRWDGAEWTYEGRKPLYYLSPEDRVTAEQAARFGKVTGSCIYCMRTLTDERSIEVGYGPICADKNGLPWG